MDGWGGVRFEEGEGGEEVEWRGVGGREDDRFGSGFGGGFGVGGGKDELGSTRGVRWSVGGVAAKLDCLEWFA